MLQHLPHRAVAADLRAAVGLRILASTAKPPAASGWQHEIKHDGHRLVVILDNGGSLRLLSRRGANRTLLFKAPFDKLAALGRPMVIERRDCGAR